jgi:hypothetical protein
MMAHPLALQLRNLQTLVVSTIQELGGFLSRETSAAAVKGFGTVPVVPRITPPSPNGDAPKVGTASPKPASA